MQLPQALETAGLIGLVGSGFVLGLRHGIDWDHLAAIFDIAGSTAPPEAAKEHKLRQTGPVAVVDRRRSFWLAFLYIVGHATVVVALGLLALFFAQNLPDWIDPIMERIVGITLVGLGIWVVYSLIRVARGEEEFQLRSRWMLAFAAFGFASRWIRAKLGGHSHDGHYHVDDYSARTAFGVGAIHGIGAETGTQALLFATVAGSFNQFVGAAILLAFSIGLVLSNSMIAAFASSGLAGSRKIRPLYIGVGVLTAIFSLFVGSYFILGASGDLPDFQQAVIHVFGHSPLDAD